MNPFTWPGNRTWSPFSRILFRFAFIYFLLYIAPWNWINYLPKGSVVTHYYEAFEDWSVQAANKNLFHNFKELVQPNGSGDTSWNWTQLELLLLLAALGTLVWTVADRKSSAYNQLAYWLRIVIRYFVIMNCFGYGIIKLFMLQMPFPNLSQLSTPLGDYLPMRLSWMFIGYSRTYQFFSGVVEVLAGLLLLFRRTATFGALLSAGVFGNIMLLNLSYDIPVKLFSIHLFVMSLTLLAFEYKRIVRFLFLNQSVPPGSLYSVGFPRKWMRIAAPTLKVLFIAVVVGWAVVNDYQAYQQVHHPREMRPVSSGIYDVAVFVVNKDTIRDAYSDTARWQEVIFERDGSGSIRTSDTLFRRRYNRGYFSYSADTAKQELLFTKKDVRGNSFDLFRLHYELPDSNTIRLHGSIGRNELYTELRKSRRSFQLAEEQFHWLSEYNR